MVVFGVVGWVGGGGGGVYLNPLSINIFVFSACVSS